MTAFLPGLWLKGRMGLSLGSGGGYLGKLRGLFGSSVVGLWPQNEASGTVSREIVNGYNGVYAGVTLGVPSIGDGNTAASFDGTTSFNNIYSAALAAAMNFSEGTILAWAKVGAAGVWTDGTQRFICNTESANRFILGRSSTNNQLLAQIIQGGTSKLFSITASPLTYFCIALTWSKSADEAKAYYQGTQNGATQTGLGTPSGTAQTSCVIGARNTTPTVVWSGSIGPVCLLNRAATLAELQQAAIVP